jgi:hypothetical protein
LTKAELRGAQRALLQELGTRVTKYGFEPKPVGQSFYCDIPGGRWALHVSFIRHERDLDVTVDVAVRIDAIEQIVNRHDAEMSDAEKRRSATLGAELGNIVKREPLRWGVSDASDILVAVDGIVAAFEKIGLPYLKANSNVNAAYRVLASLDPRDWVHSPILGARCMRAVAAAHILGLNSDLDQLIHRCQDRLSREDDLYVSDFRALCDSLRPQ